MRRVFFVGSIFVAIFLSRFAPAPRRCRRDGRERSGPNPTHWDVHPRLHGRRGRAPASFRCSRFGWP